MTKKFDIPRLKLREGTGIYATGQARIQQILEAAFDIVMKKGYSALSLREIARQCGIRSGAVSYYYKTKEDLIRDLLESALATYEDFVAQLQANEDLSAEQRLGAMIEMVLEDIRSEKTTKFYPEIWALANHDPFVARLIDRTYEIQREVLSELIREVNPRVSKSLASDLALYISASMEGMTIFVGYNRSQEDRFDRMLDLSVQNFFSLIKSAA